MQLKNFDRVAIGAEEMIFYDPMHVVEGVNEMSVDDCLKEFGEANASEKNAANSDLARRMEEFEKMKVMWEEQRKKEEEDAKESARLAAEMAAKAGDNEAAKAAAKEAEAEAARHKQQALQEQEMQMKALQQEMLQSTIKELVPKLTEAKMLCEVLNRSFISFKPSLFANVGAKQHEVNIKIEVQNLESDENIQIEVYEFNKALSWLKDEVKKLKIAIDDGKEYVVQKDRDPLTLFFDNTYHLGNAVFFPEMLAYNLPTEGDDSNLKITNSVHPYNSVGTLEVKWTPLG